MKDVKKGMKVKFTISAKQCGINSNSNIWFKGKISKVINETAIILNGWSKKYNIRVYNALCVSNNDKEFKIKLIHE